EPARLVSTRNGNPAREDLRAVIREGVPGTSMTPLPTLSDTEVEQLVDIVVQMRRAGIRDQYIAMLEEDQEPVDEHDVADVVETGSAPGEPVVVPEIPPPNPNSIAAGQALYVQQTCHSCHGDAGTGDDTAPVFDHRGLPSYPRDLVHDVFKGGNHAPSIYLRIRLGMPGTPHPANVAVDEQQLIALVHYCLSLGKTPKRSLTNHQRAVQAWRRDSHLSDSAGIGGISFPRPGSTDALRHAASVRAGAQDTMRGVSSRRDDLGTPLFAEVIGSLARGVARPHDIGCGPAAGVSLLGWCCLCGICQSASANAGFGLQWPPQSVALRSVYFRLGLAGKFGFF
ncbi:MAG: cytochrome c, partial [Planctomycetes bacterium]|nr:cytochrome c [Planctomycetota bacterium]